MSNECDYAQAENKGQLRQDLLYQLVILVKSLPYPTSGHTYQ
ncbi:acyl-CoA dehydrogenase, partial [Acinetobacter baumannii]